MKKAIVTGANGFVGGAVTRTLIKNGVRVIALDMEGCNNNIPNSEMVEFYPFSLDAIDDLEEVLKDKNADIFYHFAWAGSAGPQRANTELQLKNAQWTVDCLRFAKKIGCTRFVNAGSIMEQETIKAVFINQDLDIYMEVASLLHIRCANLLRQILELIFYGQ